MFRIGTHAFHASSPDLRKTAESASATPDVERDEHEEVRSARRQGGGTIGGGHGVEAHGLGARRFPLSAKRVRGTRGGRQ